MRNLIYVNLNYLNWLVFATLMGSCKCGNPDGGGPLQSVGINYQNVKGQDMFDTATPNYFKKDSIKWRYLRNPVGFEETLQVSSNRIEFTYYPSSSDKITDDRIIIKLNKTTYDTLTLTGDAALRKVVYNSKTIPPPSGSNDYPQIFYFSVVK